jgi:hypothetical protein
MNYPPLFVIVVVRVLSVAHEILLVDKKEYLGQLMIDVIH